MVSYLKFLIKVRLISSLRSFLVFFGPRINKQGWENRILVVYLEAIGDTVVLTSILKHFKSAFPGKEIYFLTPIFDIRGVVGPFVDRVVTLDYKRFVRDPFYGAVFIGELKKIGFETVINSDHSAAEVIGKIISVSLSAKNIIGYEGFGLSFNHPLDLNMKKNVEFVSKRIYPRFTTLIPSIDKGVPHNGVLKNVIEHFINFYEQISNRKENDYSPLIKVERQAETKVDDILRTHGLSSRPFVIINLGSSSRWKNWPVERFVEVSEEFGDKNISVVLIGSLKERSLAGKFINRYKGPAVDLVGQLTILEVAVLIEKSLLVFSNDTAPIHLAVALKKPSICILGGGHFGKISLYGYRDINRWVYKELDCFGDNWRCTLNLKSNQIAPCINTIKIEDVRLVIKEMLQYISSTPGLPKEKFSLSFVNQ